MKIRSGFVSNSSSSSFIIIGNKLNSYDEAEAALLNNHKVMAVGKYLTQGVDVFDLDCDMLEIIATSKLTHNIDLYKVYLLKYYEECDETGIDIDAYKFPQKYTIFTFEKDDHSTQTLNLFKERYYHSPA